MMTCIFCKYSFQQDMGDLTQKWMGTGFLGEWYIKCPECNKLNVVSGLTKEWWATKTGKTDHKNKIEA